jgi:hypothetical protein
VKSEEEKREESNKKRRYWYSSHSVGYNEHQEVLGVPHSCMRKYVICEDIRNVWRKKSRDYYHSQSDELKEKRQEYNKKYRDKKRESGITSGHENLRWLDRKTEEQKKEYRVKDNKRQRTKNRKRLGLWGKWIIGNRIELYKDYREEIEEYFSIFVDLFQKSNPIRERVVLVMDKMSSVPLKELTSTITPLSNNEYIISSITKKLTDFSVESNGVELLEKLEDGKPKTKNEKQVYYQMFYEQMNVDFREQYKDILKKSSFPIWEVLYVFWFMFRERLSIEEQMELIFGDEREMGMNELIQLYEETETETKMEDIKKMSIGKKKIGGKNTRWIKGRNKLSITTTKMTRDERNEYQRKYYHNQPDEQKKQMSEKRKEYQRTRYKNMTDEQRGDLREKQRQKYWMNKDPKNKDQVYKVKVIKLQEEFILQVPKGVEMNQEILENSSYLDEYKNKEDVSISFSKVDKKLWLEDKHPSLDRDGTITFDDDDYCE